MKKAIGIAVFACLPQAVPAMASPAEITYDCDTAAGHFSELALPTPSGPFTVTGTAQLMTMAGSPKFAPTLRVQIASASSPGTSPTSYGGFTLAALPLDPSKTRDGRTAVQMLSYSVSGKEDELLPLSLLTKPGTVQPFTLQYDGKSVTVALGVESKRLPVVTADPMVRIVCSTGEFLITGLTIKPAP